MTISTVPQWLSIAEAADLIHVSPKSIRRWIAAGDLTARRAGPRLIRIDRQELDRLMSPVA